MLDFDRVIEKFRHKELDIRNWNFAINKEDTYYAYIMGEGSEQCLARKGGFANEKEIVDLYKSIGVKNILQGV